MEFMVARPRLRPRTKSGQVSLGGRPKRLFDVAFGTLFLVLTLPILVVTAAALKLAGARKVLAKEKRLGFRGRSFVMIEFATSSRDWPAVRRFETFLHDSGIHKLPQLVNVLRGEMSLVGPRALLPCEASLPGDRIATYLAAKPGLIQARRNKTLTKTGALQLLDIDLDYIQNWSFSTDIVALLRTIFTLNDQ